MCGLEVECILSCCLNEEENSLGEGRALQHIYGHLTSLTHATAVLPLESAS